MTDHKKPGRYDLTDGGDPYRSDSTPPEKDTRSIAIDLDSKVSRLVDERARQRIAGYWKIGLSLVGVAGALLSVGAVYQQTRQTSEDVARVLVVVEQLGRDGATTRAGLDEAARDRGQLREQVRTLEQKVWTIRPHDDRPGTRAPAE